MAYTRRTAEQRTSIAERAKALRRDGATMAEIARSVGVPAPTLSQWAARDGWRVRDLEATGSITYPGTGPVHPGQPCQAPSGKPVPDPEPLEWVPRTGREMTQDAGRNSPTPDHLRAAGEAAFAAALELAAKGQARAARDQLLLGQRFMAAAGVALADEPEAIQSDWDDPRAELERRLLRLLDVEMKRRYTAIGVDQLSEGIDVEALDLSIFYEADEDNPRAATPAELARMEAGDWPLRRDSGPE